jgi:mono/diheme cytochrome c family protein
VKHWRQGLLAVLCVAALLALIGAGCGGGTSQKVTPSTSPSPAEKTPAELLAAEEINDVPRWVKAEKLPAAALPGAKLFALSGCTTCHTYLDSGAANLDAPDLTAIGTRHLGISFQIRHLKCPSCATPGSPMPELASLGGSRLHQLAVFLEASRGRR